MLRGFVSFVNRRKWLAGPCLALFFVFSEFIPLAGTVDDIRKQSLMLSVNYFLDPFPALGPMPALLLGVPAAAFLLVSLLPLLERKFSPGLFALFLSGFSFYPVLYLSRGTWFEPLVWAILLAPIVALNLWVRSIDYFYSMVVGLLFMDLGAAVRGYWLGLPAIGVPYSPALAPAAIIAIDTTLLAAAALLWWRGVDFGKRWGWKWLEALE